MGKKTFYVKADINGYHEKYTVSASSGLAALERVEQEFDIPLVGTIKVYKSIDDNGKPRGLVEHLKYEHPDEVRKAERAAAKKKGHQHWTRGKGLRHEALEYAEGTSDKVYFIYERAGNQVDVSWGPAAAYWDRKGSLREMTHQFGSRKEMQDFFDKQVRAKVAKGYTQFSPH